MADKKRIVRRGRPPKKQVLTEDGELDARFKDCLPLIKMARPRKGKEIEFLRQLLMKYAYALAQETRLDFMATLRENLKAVSLTLKNYTASYSTADFESRLAALEEHDKQVERERKHGLKPNSSFEVVRKQARSDQAVH